MSYQEQESLKKKVKARILMINEDIKNNLASLTLEDNFDEDEVRLYYENKNKAIEYEQTTESVKLSLSDLEKETSSSIKTLSNQISLKVKKKDVVTQLNAESTGLYFKTKLFLVDTPNFKVTENSCYVNGTVYATSANIAGWAFSNGAMTGTTSSWIEGGTVEADSASCSFVSADGMNLNPDYEGTYHIVNMKNATWAGDPSSSKDDPPNFGSISSRSGVTISNDLNINGGNNLHCTTLYARNGTGSKNNYVTIYCTEMVTETESWSDIRLKKDIEDITESEAEIILKLRPVSYELIKTGTRGTGLIAQEVIKEIKGFDNIVTKPDGEYYAIAYRQLIPFMIKQIQINNMKLERIRGNGKGNI